MDFFALDEIAAPPAHADPRRGDGKVYASPVDVRRWIARHPVLAFYGVAYACSWVIAVPLALQAQGVTHTRLPLALHYVTAFGPAIAALAIGHSGDTRSRPLEHRKTNGALWWVIGFASPLVLFIGAQLAARAAGEPVQAWSSLGRLNFLPDFGAAAWLFWFVTNGVGEELGWRGFALPRLERSHSALASSALLACAWGGWHIPAFFYLPSYMALGLVVLPGFFLGILAGSIVLTWLYNSSGGRVMAAVLWHASFNFVTASPNAAGLTAEVASVLVIAWAVAVLALYGSSSLSSTRNGRWSVRADETERRKRLPGDELIDDPLASFTYAITIRRPQQEVWPWLVQMGAGSRAGWYSYDFLDNGRHPSATRIVPELQQVAVGTVFPALPGATDGFTLLMVEPERFLVLGWLGPLSIPLVTWAFVLQDAGAHSTRLIVRARGAHSYESRRTHWWQGQWFLPMIHFTMQRKQLLGIARRAETSARAA